MIGSLPYRWVALLLLVFPWTGAAQDLSSMKDAKPLALSGNASLQQGFLFTRGMEGNRPPYTVMLNGALDVAVFGFHVPLTMTYSNRQASFRQPFNRFSLTPKYKGLKTYIGYSSMTFSPLTLNGHLFLGAGAELKINEKLAVAAMYGRLRKEVSTTDSLAREEQSYKRTGHGLKTTYKTSVLTLESVLFKAGDVVTPTSANIVEIMPEDNLVVSLKGQVRAFEKVEAGLEQALSIITANKLLTPNDRRAWLVRNASTTAFTAFSSFLRYKGPFTTGVVYSRTSPGYRTLGAYYFNSDLETVKLQFQGKVGKKLDFSTELGMQRNNLGEDRVSGTRRLSSGLQASFVPNKQFHANASWSNFRSFTNSLMPHETEEDLDLPGGRDTLIYRQLSSQGNVNLGVRLPGDRRPQLGAGVTCQVSEEMQGGGAVPGGLFLSGNLSYRLKWGERLKAGAAMTASVQEGAEVRTYYVGPSLRGGYVSSDKKLRANSGINVSLSNTAGRPGPVTLTCRMGGVYTINKKHMVSLRTSVVYRDLPEGAKNTLECRGILGYQFKF